MDVFTLFQIRDLKRAIHLWCTKTRFGKLSDVGKLQDIVGMTPLHILACSTKHHLEMYQLLVEKYPENLVTKDQWEDFRFWMHCGVMPRVKLLNSQ